MIRPLCLAVALLSFGADLALAAARTPEAAARASARRRGYTPAQTACFVPIFTRYAYQTRSGTWIGGPRSRRGDAYRHEAWAKCGVLR